MVCMSKPPVNADPEKFILGDGMYTNLQTAGSYADERIFRIEPSPLPLGSVLTVNLIFANHFFGFHWMMRQFSQLPHGPGPWVVYGAPVGIGLTTCGLLNGIVYYSFAKARRLGPWLVYDKASGQVELPRENIRFERREIVLVQYITTKRLDQGGDRLSELNLITLRDGTRKRWPLLRSTLQSKAFDQVLQPLLAHTDLPVVRVEDKWLGWDVMEKPYGQPNDDG